jgi:hypothetical protein
MRVAKVFRISDVLVKSQLRSARSGRFSQSFLNRPAAIALLDVVAFVVAAAIVSRVLVFIPPSIPGFSLPTIARETLIFLPALIQPLIFVASLLFELNVSSKFAASDTLNWLPVSQGEYVSASALSICFIYSVFPAVVLGGTLPIAWSQGLLPVWVVATLLSIVALYTGALLVEILRATLNRVSTSALGKARRGALLVRLVVSITVIVIFQFFFNPLVLLGLLGVFNSDVAASVLIPFLWPSSVVREVVDGQALTSLGFTGLSVGFAAFMTWSAVKVRSRFWSPSPVSVTVSHTEYAPKSGSLPRFGFSVVESALMRKDLKGLTRRREMVPFLAIPFVMTAAFLLPRFTISSSAGGAPPAALGFPLLLVGGIFALIFSSVSIGQEGKAMANIYTLPIAPAQYLRAKAAVAITFALAVTAVMIILTSASLGLRAGEILPALLLSPVVAVEETFIGLGFASRYPDFSERLRPRFVRPLGMLIALPTGVAIMLVTISPVIISLIASSIALDLGSIYWALTLGAFIFALAVSLLAYRWARAGVMKLLCELQA